MTDIQEIYSILLSRNYQEELFSDLPGQRKREGKETKAVCPICNKDNFSYSRERPVWRCWSCGEAGDWIDYLQKEKGHSFQQALAYLAERAGVEISPHIQEGYKAYVRKADILEEAQSYFSQELDKTGSLVFNYLTDRGYSAEEIYGMELGEYKDKKALQDYLKKAGYTDQEIRDSGLLTIGEDWPLTLLWRDQSGRAIGLVGRSILSDQELKERDLQKYKYSYGLQQAQGMVGFSSVRGSPEIIVVEGVMDALLLNYKGLKSVSLGGKNLSADQLKALETVGTKELLLALDMDQPGQNATEKMLQDLKTSRLRAYVVSLPEGYKDADELIRALGVEVFQKALETAERSPSWMAKRIASRHDITTARGMDQALEEAGVHLSDIKHSLEIRDFMASLQKATGLSKEDLDSRLLEVSRTASARRAQSILERDLRELQQKASQGDITGAEADLSRLLDQIRHTRGVRLPEPHLLEDLLREIKTITPALSSGYSWLDKIAKIPTGALTIIAGRPGQGKTAFQLNLLVNMLRIYPDKRFYFFSYEEQWEKIASKIIMIMAGEILQAETNQGAYINYLQEKRGTNKKIDLAIQEYEKASKEGRLLVSDDMYRIEDLATVIELLAKTGETGAVFIDYIQRIPAPTQSQRYLDIKLISDTVLRQAVSLGIPIILGAQLNRASGGGAEATLAELREGGDIEQDASLVLSLYSEALEKAQSNLIEAKVKRDTEVVMKVSVLKNRGGQPGISKEMRFIGPILTIRQEI